MQRAVAALLVGATTGFSFHNGAMLRPALRKTVAPIMSAVTDEVWTMAPAVRVEGNTLKTWDIGDESIERVQVAVKSDGRPIDADVQLWTTPSYIPTKFRVYTEDGASRPVTAVVESPVSPKTVAVYNKASMEFPFDATVANTGLGKAYDSHFEGVEGTLVQGAGTIKSFTFGSEVESIHVLLKTNERNMKAKIEVTQGPNQVKQVIELYASKGYKNPFYAIIATPGTVSTVRVINENTVEFPFDAWVLPYEVGSGGDGVVLGGGF